MSFFEGAEDSFKLYSKDCSRNSLQLENLQWISLKKFLQRGFQVVYQEFLQKLFLRFVRKFPLNNIRKSFINSIRIFSMDTFRKSSKNFSRNLCDYIKKNFQEFIRNLSSEISAQIILGDPSDFFKKLFYNIF